MLPVAVVSFSSLTTVTSQVAEMFSPPFAVAVIVAEPSATAVTTPSATVATLSSLEDHVTDLSVAFPGAMVAVSVLVFPTSIVASWSSVMPVTATPFTVI